MILPTVTAFYLALGGINVNIDEHDPFNGAVPLLNYSFESDEDQDYDIQPDDWTRRKGDGFPKYVNTEIDLTRGRHKPGELAGRSLQFQVNGGPAIMYSPSVPIDALHSYIFEGYILTEGLEHDAAILSVSFLNHKRQRIQRFLSKPVTGSHRDWVRVRIMDMAPHPDASFAVVGCHLVSGRKMDIRGSVWFDDLWMGKLPQMTLVSNFYKHFIQRNAEIQITSNVTGLDQKSKYQLHLQLENSSKTVIEEETRDLIAIKPDPNKPAGSLPQAREPELWNLSPKDYGFYRVRSALKRDGKVVLSKETSFAVMDLVDTVRKRGEFGWSLPPEADEITAEKLSDVATESGINWIKYPLWQSVHSKDKEWPARITNLFDLMLQNQITPVGLLGDPPDELRNQFARDWTGVSEIFSMQPSFWSPSLEPVIARYSSTVRYWQLGSDTDSSFVGMTTLPTTLANVENEFNRIGRDTRIGIHWLWPIPPPKSSRIRQTFFSFLSDGSLPEEEFLAKLRSINKSGLSTWVIIKPLSVKYDPEQRGIDLVKRMVLSKIAGADVIFASNILDKEHGMLNVDGSPTLLFLPWRTTALALQGTEYLGSFHFPRGSSNYAFARGDEVVIIAWNELKPNEKPIVEEIYLGENVTITDVFGRQRKANISNNGFKRQVIEIGTTPLVIRGCSEPIARWRMAAQFAKGRLASQHGGQREAILGKNTFTFGVNGRARLNIPSEWEAEPKEWSLQLAANDEIELRTALTLPPNASLGKKPVTIDFDITADRPYKFRVYRAFEVGLNDVRMNVVERFLPDGRIEIEQTITNSTEPLEILDFRCSLIIYGHKRQNQRVTKLGKGQDKKFYYLPNGNSLRNEPIWLRVEQEGGRRTLNSQWKIGQNEEKEE